MNLTIDAKSPLPVYQQVIQAIKLEILSGGLRDGDLLPLLRDLAKPFQFNPNTVVKVYYALAEAFRRGSPSFRMAGMMTGRKGPGQLSRSMK